MPAPRLLLRKLPRRLCRDLSKLSRRGGASRGTAVASLPGAGVEGLEAEPVLAAAPEKGTGVVAVDAGTNQLAWKLRDDPRVEVHEKTNARNLQPDDYPSPFDLIVMDVSFISVTKIIPVFPPLLKEGGRVIILIKPQFEVGKGEVGKGGIVREPEKHERVVNKVNACAESLGLTPLGVIENAASFMGEQLAEENLKQLSLQPAAAEVLGDVAEACRLIQKNVAHAARLVQSFKKLSVGQLAEPRVQVDLVRVIQEVLNVF